MLGRTNRLGHILAGFVADILFLNQNPLERIRVFDEPDRHLLAVIKEGWVQVSRWTKLAAEVNEQLRVIEW